jgi:hypothetical protein
MITISLINLRGTLPPGPTHKAEPHPKFGGVAGHPTPTTHLTFPAQRVKLSRHAIVPKEDLLEAPPLMFLVALYHGALRYFFTFSFVSEHNGAAAANPVTRSFADVSLPDGCAGSLPSRHAIWTPSFG